MVIGLLQSALKYEPEKRPLAEEIDLPIRGFSEGVREFDLI